MTWFELLKMPNPHGGQWNELTRDQYYEMDDKNKNFYHKAMRSMYQKKIRLAVAPRKAGQAPPATDDQIRELREEYRFHARQRHRLEDESEMEAPYSLEEEKNRISHKPRYDAVERMPHTTEEMYDNYTREEKRRYWSRLGFRFIGEELGRKAIRMYMRMRDNPNYTPPFEGDESNLRDYVDTNVHRVVSEYNEFTDEEKIKYHGRMASRFRINERELYAFHIRMRKRAVDKLPTYPTPEAKKEAEE